MLTALSDLIKTIFYEDSPWNDHVYEWKNFLYLYCSWSEGGDYHYDPKNSLSLSFHSWSENRDHVRDYEHDRE